MLNDAIGYLRDFEWSVFPVCSPIPGKPGYCLYHGQCKHPGKLPLVRWGASIDEPASEAKIREWWGKWPQANIGLACGAASDVVVIDLDGELAIAEATRRGYPSGPWTTTGRVGGRHLYFRYRADAPTVFAKVGGIDFRGHGGYVLLPPSLHVSGTRYTWAERVLRGDPLPVLPAWIDELATTDSHGQGHRKVEYTEPLSEGTRDQEIFRRACKLRGADVPYDMAVKLAREWAVECKPPFPVDEAISKVDSAYRHYSPNGVVSVNGTFTADSIDGVDLPEPRWAVPGIFPEGVVLLAGKSKLGKSWFVLDIAVAITTDGLAWGKIEVEHGKALYLALEDSKRRIQSRLYTLVGESKLPKDLTFKLDVHRANEGGLDTILDWLDQNPTARLVVIDVLGKFRPRESTQKRLYDMDYESIAPLAAVARERGICVIVVHHANKLSVLDPIDSVSGTTGLVGAADGICIFRRERGKHEASLLVTGRDVEEQELAFSMDLAAPRGHAWELTGDAAELRMNAQRTALLDIITARPGMSAAEIATAAGYAAGPTRQRLWQMWRADQVRNLEGKYFPRPGKVP